MWLAHARLTQRPRRMGSPPATKGRYRLHLSPGKARSWCARAVCSPPAHAARRTRRLRNRRPPLREPQRPIRPDVGRMSSSSE
eukprot:4635091-Pleurochrysis_carterae.AAC.3